MNVNPKISFLPIIIEALKNDDADAKKFQSELGTSLTKEILTAWKKTPGRVKAKRFYLSRNSRLPRGSFAEQLAAQSLAYDASKKKLTEERMKIVKGEYRKFIQSGVAKYSPSSFVRKDPALLHDTYRYFDKRKSHCCCNEPGNPPTSEQPTKKHGVKVTQINCQEHDELFHDEVYMISTAVDGNGELLTSVSNRFDMNDGDDSVVYPNHWVYPVQDSGGFLDVAIALWEDDGGYEEIGDKISKIGSAVSKIPSPYTVAAGTALNIIGEVIGLISLLDSDDHYGDGTHTWSSLENLQSGVGGYSFNCFNPDTGLFDITSYDYDVSYNLIEA